MSHQFFHRIRQELAAVCVAGGILFAATTACAAVGEVNLFAGSSVPTGWLAADGSIVSRTAYPDLFATIGTTYGAGDGSTTFKLPDMRGRTAVGAGNGVNLTARTLGQAFGADQIGIGLDHTHSYNGAAAGMAMTGSSTLPGIGFELAQPSLAVNQIIKVSGSTGLGAVSAFGGASAPNGWLVANGAVVSRTTYSGLFSVIGTTYGAGDGSTTFKLPDLRGRTAVGAGNGVNLMTRTLGQAFGADQIGIGLDHTHSYNGAAAGMAMTGSSTLPGIGFELAQPSLGLSSFIKANGGADVGQVGSFAGSITPADWLAADGSLVLRSAYPDLFAIIGTTFGAGDGSTTFKLPDLRGRTAVGAGAGFNLTSRTLGQAFGADQIGIGLDHTHSYNGAAAGMAMTGSSTLPGIGFQLSQPSLALTYAIQVPEPSVATVIVLGGFVLARRGGRRV